MFFWIRYILILASAGTVLYLIMQTDAAALRCPFELEASEQWTIQQERPGDFVAKHFKGRLQALAGVTTYRFDRYDVVGVELAPGVEEGSIVKKGDHVLTFHSLYDESQRKQLEAEVEKFQAALDALLSGELQSRVEEGEKLLAQAITNYNSYLPLVKRRRELYNTGFISNDEVQQMEDELNDRLIQISVVKADLDARRQACSSNVINTARGELKVAQKSLEMVDDRLAARIVKTPIQGRVTQVSLDPASQTILRVVNEEPIYARCVASIRFSSTLTNGCEIVFRFPNEEFAVTGAVEKVSVVPVPLMGISVLHALVPLYDLPTNRISSMTGEATVPSIKIDPVNQLKTTCKNITRTLFSLWKKRKGAK